MEKARIKAEGTTEADKITSGEKSLWLSVLLQAIREACKDESRESREALRWLSERREERREQVGSAAWICEQTDFRYLSAFIRVAVAGTKEERELLRKILI
jgi:hypothetical protein